MKLGELVRIAINNQDPNAAGKVADCCRFKLGMNYPGTLAFVQKVCPEVTMAQWDELLYEADTTG